MKYSILLVGVVCLFMGRAQNYQDSVILLNGKTFRGNVIKQADDFLTLNTFEKEGKPETQISIETYRVFSYTQNGNETVLYKQDSMQNFLTEDQSRRFALGGFDAYNFYDTKAVFYSSAAIALGFCLFDTYLTPANRDKIGNPDLNTGFLGRSPSIWPIASVLVLPISFGLPSTKVRPKNLVNGIRGDNYYYSGFNSVARQRRSFSALKGAVSGLVLGYVSYAVFHTNDF